MECKCTAGRISNVLDRLVKELRLRGISTMDDANRYLPEFMDDYNRRFARAARNDRDAHRPLLERDCLDDIFTWQEERRVTAQLTVHHKRTMYLLEPTEEANAAARKRVTVVEYEDGGVSIRYRGVALAARQAPTATRAGARPVCQEQA